MAVKEMLADPKALWTLAFCLLCRFHVHYECRPFGRLIGSFCIYNCVLFETTMAPNGAPCNGIPFAVVGLQFGLTSNHFMWIWSEFGPIWDMPWDTLKSEILCW